MVGYFVIENLEEVGYFELVYNVPLSLDVSDSINNNDERPYDVIIGDIPAEIRFSRKYDFRYKVNGLDLANNSKVDEDRSAILSYMEFCIRFDARVLEMCDNKGETITTANIGLGDEILEISIQYLNKFISVYRACSCQFWVRNIVRKDIFNFNYSIVDIFSKVDHCVRFSNEGPVAFNGKKDIRLPREAEQNLRKKDPAILLK